MFIVPRAVDTRSSSGAAWLCARVGNTHRSARLRSGAKKQNASKTATTPQPGETVKCPDPRLNLNSGFNFHPDA